MLLVADRIPPHHFHKVLMEEVMGKELWSPAPVILVAVASSWDIG